MKVLLDIQDKKAPALMEVLKSLPYVKTEALTSYKLKVLRSLKQSVKEMTLIKQGKLKGRNAKDLLNEL